MKRKRLILLLCAVLLCGVVVYGFIPMDVATQAEQLKIWRVQRMVGDAEFEDVTAQMDLAQLSAAITSCKASRVPFYQNAYQIDTVQYEIDGYDAGKPLHLVLGKNSFVYESTPWVYRLHDAQVLIGKLDAMLAADAA